MSATIINRGTRPAASRRARSSFTPEQLAAREAARQRRKEHRALHSRIGWICQNCGTHQITDYVPYKPGIYAEDGTLVPTETEQTGRLLVRCVVGDLLDEEGCHNLHEVYLRAPRNPHGDAWKAWSREYWKWEAQRDDHERRRDAFFTKPSEWGRSIEPVEQRFRQQPPPYATFNPHKDVLSVRMMDPRTMTTYRKATLYLNAPGAYINVELISSYVDHRGLLMGELEVELPVDKGIRDLVLGLVEDEDDRQWLLAGNRLNLSFPSGPEIGCWMPHATRRPPATPTPEPAPEADPQAEREATDQWLKQQAAAEAQAKPSSIPGALQEMLGRLEGPDGLAVSPTDGLSPAIVRASLKRIGAEPAPPAETAAAEVEVEAEIQEEDLLLLSAEADRAPGELAASTLPCLDVDHPADCECGAGTYLGVDELDEADLDDLDAALDENTGFFSTGAEPTQAEPAQAEPVLAEAG